jgi:hypothetical protein
MTVLACAGVSGVGDFTRWPKKSPFTVTIGPVLKNRANADASSAEAVFKAVKSSSAIDGLKTVVTPTASMRLRTERGT